MAWTWDKVCDFEEGDTTDYDAETDADGDLNATTDSKYNGSYGVELTFDDANAAYGRLSFASTGKTSFSFEQWFNRSTVAVNAGAVIDLAYFYGDGALKAFLRLSESGGSYYLAFYTVNDGAGVDLIGQTVVTAEWNRINLGVKVATGVGANDGEAYFHLDGALIGSSVVLDNDTIDYDFVLVGMIWTNATAQSGSYYADDQSVADTLLRLKALAGTLTSAGTPTKIPKKPLAGTFELIGSMGSWKIFKVAAGAITPVGTVVKKVHKVLSGLMNWPTFVGLTGAVTKKISGPSWTFAGTLISTGTIVVKALKELGGLITPTISYWFVRQRNIFWKVLVTLAPNAKITTILAPRGRVMIDTTPEDEN